MEKQRRIYFTMQEGKNRPTVFSCIILSRNLLLQSYCEQDMNPETREIDSFFLDS